MKSFVGLQTWESFHHWFYTRIVFYSALGNLPFDNETGFSLTLTEAGGTPCAVLPTGVDSLHRGHRTGALGQVRWSNPRFFHAGTIVKANFHRSPTISQGAPL